MLLVLIFLCVIIITQRTMPKQIEKKLISNEIVSSAIMIKVLTLRFFAAKGFEITPEQFVILDTISKNNGLYQRQISELIGKDRANVARILNILEKKGLIKKNQASNGRAINRLELTLEGENLRAKIEPHIEEIRKSYLDDIKEEDIEKCYEVLNKIKNNIGKNIKLHI